MSRSFAKILFAKSSKLMCIAALADLMGSACTAAGTMSNSGTPTETPAAYRRYLDRIERDRNTDHGLAMNQQARRARERLEDLIYHQAVKAARPLGFRRYLQEFPKGRYARDARVRLATMALARSRTEADYLLVMERYRGTAQAEEAAKRLSGAVRPSQ